MQRKADKESALFLVNSESDFILVAADMYYRDVEALIKAGREKGFFVDVSADYDVTFKMPPRIRITEECIVATGDTVFMNELEYSVQIVDATHLKLGYALYHVQELRDTLDKTGGNIRKKK